MRKTRADILIELEHRFGHSEETEHLLDWVRDLWETRDLLLKRLGSAYTMVILNAEASCSLGFRLDDLVTEEVLQEIPNALLN